MRHPSLAFSIPALIAILLFAVPGCARQIEQKKQLEVTTHHSGNLVVSAKGDTPRTIFLDVQGSDTAVLARHLETALKTANYKIVDSPSKAGYILHLTLVREGEVGSSVFSGIVNAGYGADAKFSGSGSSGLIADALLVKRRVPAGKPGQARLKNISTRNAIDNSQMRLGLLASRPVHGSQERNAVFAEPLARELGRALAGGSLNTAAASR